MVSSNKYFEYYNCNPKNKKGSDCVVRAVSTFFNESWVDTVKSMTETGLKYGYVLNDPHCIERHLKASGLTKRKEPRTINNKKISVQEWLKMNPDASCIANVGSHHLTVIKNGRVYDIFDCSTSTMHSYWEIENV